MAQAQDEPQLIIAISPGRRARGLVVDPDETTIGPGLSLRRIRDAGGKLVGAVLIVYLKGAPPQRLGLDAESLACLVTGWARLQAEEPTPAKRLPVLQRQALRLLSRPFAFAAYDATHMTIHTEGGGAFDGVIVDPATWRALLHAGWVEASGIQGSGYILSQSGADALKADLARQEAEREA